MSAAFPESPGNDPGVQISQNVAGSDPHALASLLEIPVIQAPMAGGPASVELAGAVSEAGGLGFLAAGYKTSEAMYEQIRAVRGLTKRPFGVNLFVPPAGTGAPGHRGETLAAVEVYREQLAGEATWYETALGDPEQGTDDAYEGKLAVLYEHPVPVVSFTFGCPSARTVEGLRLRGSLTIVTVTSVAEARAAQDVGADALCVQGVEAGGHQSTHHNDPFGDGDGIGLLSLVTQVRHAVSLPLIATGGLMRGEQIAAALIAGADAAQLGTAFLPCPESGAHPLHKQALTNPLFTRTELTKAFSGRPARALVNRFMREHGPYAPAAYPQVHHLTAGLRKAAATAGDAQGMALWAGQGHQMARALPAGELVALLGEELKAARGTLLGGDAS